MKINSLDLIRERAKDFKELIKNGQKILIAGHKNPDGDCIGAMLGLYFLLKELGKEPYVVLKKEEVSDSYFFLKGIEETISCREVSPDFDIAIAVDTPNLKRLGDAAFLFEKTDVTVNIDHHPDNVSFATLNIVTPEISSTSEIVFWLTLELLGKIPEDAREPLYVGVVTDTGRFQYSNTYPSTFELAKTLVEDGIRPVEIFRNVYENVRKEVLTLLGVVLERVENKNGFFWSYLNADDFSGNGVKPAEIENFIDYIRSIRGCKVAALFRETRQHDKWKVSLRSRGGFDVQKIAAHFGGGGHIEASGCEIEGSLEEAVERVYVEYLKQEDSMEGKNA